MYPKVLMTKVVETLSVLFITSFVVPIWESRDFGYQNRVTVRLETVEVGGRNWSFCINDPSSVQFPLP